MILYLLGILMNNYSVEFEVCCNGKDDLSKSGEVSIRSKPEFAWERSIKPFDFQTLQRHITKLRFVAEIEIIA